VYRADVATPPSSGAPATGPTSSPPTGQVLGPGGYFGDGVRHGGAAGPGGAVVARQKVVCLLLNKELLQDVCGAPLAILLEQQHRYRVQGPVLSFCRQFASFVGLEANTVKGRVVPGNKDLLQAVVGAPLVSLLEQRHRCDPMNASTLVPR
jgi:hypothetical protein